MEDLKPLTIVLDTDMFAGLRVYGDYEVKAQYQGLDDFNCPEHAYVVTLQPCTQFLADHHYDTEVGYRGQSLAISCYAGKWQISHKSHGRDEEGIYCHETKWESLGGLGEEISSYKKPIMVSELTMVSI